METKTKSLEAMKAGARRRPRRTAVRNHEQPTTARIEWPRDSLPDEGFPAAGDDATHTWRARLKRHGSSLAEYVEGLGGPEEAGDGWL